MHYGDILKRSAALVWRHKALWLFAYLPLIVNALALALMPLRLLAYWPMIGPILEGLSTSYSSYYSPEPSATGTLITVGLTLLLTGLQMLLSWLGVAAGYLGLTSLMGMVDEVERTGNTTVRSGWSTGWKRFLYVFLAGLLVSLPLSILAGVGGFLATPVILVVLGAAGAAAATEATALAVFAAVLGLLAGAVAWFLLLLLSVALQLLLELVGRKIVLENRGIFEAVREAWRLLRARLRQVLALWLALFGVNLAANLAIGLLLGIGAALAVWLGIAAGTVAASPIAGVLVGLVILLPFGLLSLVVLGPYAAFRSAAWTIAYREMVGFEQGR